MTGRIDPVEIADLKARTDLSSIFEQYGVKLRGHKIKWGTCCFHHEKSASLEVDDGKGFAHCFGCGWTGDHFTVLKELGGKKFGEAIEYLGGTRFITAEERKVIDDRRRANEEEERKQAEKVHSRVEKLFDQAKVIAGTHAAAYLEARCLPVGPRWTADIRFIPNLLYRGFATSEADDTVDLGTFPAMVAAIRNASGAIIGLHRTYLDPAAPAKLTPPGDASRNKAKKVMGEQRGGMIRLSPPGPVLAMGEGIETTRGWYCLGHGEPDIALAAAVSLGNMTGGASGSAEHPKDPTRRVPNGIPDMERPGVILPAEVKEVILLGDGDSEPYTTRARLLVAGRRFRASGVTPFFHVAPDGYDWADLAKAEAQKAA